MWVLLAWAQLNSCHTSPSLDKGLVYLKEREILLTNDKWTLVVNIDLNKYDGILDYIETVFQNFETFRDHPTLKLIIPWTEVSRLRSVASMLTSEINSFKSMLPETRRKRGAINAIGSGMKLLFGTMDNDDLETLSTKLYELDKTQNDILHNNKEMLTYIKSVFKNFEENAKIITVMGENVKGVLKQISYLNVSLWSDIEKVNRSLQYHMRISSLIREVELYLHSAEYELGKLMKGLDITSNGRLSSLLLPPNKMSEILSHVSQELNNDLSLISSTKLEDMYIYYELADVHAVSQTRYIQLIIDIPLKSEGRQLDLYAVKSLPFREPIINKFMYVQSNTEYIALSKTRQVYSILTNKDVNACRGNTYNVCPANIPLYSYNNDSCVYALFLGEASGAYVQCEKRIMKNFSQPILHRIPDRDAWVYSAPLPMRVTWKCNHETKTEMVKERGVLHNPHHCYIYTKYFSLLPYSYGRSTYNLTQNILVEPPMTSILSPSETEILSNKAKIEISDVTETNIDLLLHQLHKNVDDVTLDQLIGEIQRIQEEKLQSSNRRTHVVRYSGGIVSIVAVTLLLLCLYRKRRIATRCLWTSLVPASTAASAETSHDVQADQTIEAIATTVYVKPGISVQTSSL